MMLSGVPDLVGDARAELAGDRKRLGLAQPPHELERPVRLRLHPLPGLLEPLGHPVEGCRPPGPSSSPLRTGMGARDSPVATRSIPSIRSVSGRNTRRCRAAQVIRPKQEHEDGCPAARSCTCRRGYRLPGGRRRSRPRALPRRSRRTAPAATRCGSASHRFGARRRPAGPCPVRSDADRATRPGRRRGGSHRLAVARFRSSSRIRTISGLLHDQVLGEALDVGQRAARGARSRRQAGSPHS